MALTPEALRALLDEPSWSDEQARAVLDHLENGPSSQWSELLQARFEAGLAAHTPLDPVTANRLLSGIQARMSTATASVRHGWFRRYGWMAAAAVLLAAVAGVWMMRERDETPALVKAVPVKQDVQPGGNKATLTLGNGQQIILDSAANGLLAQQGTIKINKPASGQLKYEGTDKSISYNTLATPRGGQYQLTLPDGTRVWLNAASSITYPTSFAGNQRKVSITGEAYFEVAKNANMPFHVKAENVDVEVLGTHFNINAYTDEVAVKTTLLEGLVKVNSGQGTARITPGQQSVVNNTDGAARIISNADLDAAVAWKNGLFHFSNSSLQDVMRQIARWYDVDIEYNGTISPRVFGGEISRNSNVSEVLRILQVSKIHFNIEGKKIIVMP